MKFQIHNGKFHPLESTLIHSSNRGFNYGDGFFESIRVSNGKTPFIQLHWKRMKRACDILQISIPGSLTLKTFHNQVLMLARKNGEPNSRIRFQGFREGGGRYSPDNSSLGWTITSEELQASRYELNKFGLKMGVCNSITINPAPQSTFKSTNAVPYVLASIEAQKCGWDDCFMMDLHGFLSEATSSNVFLVRENEIITPNLSNGGVSGVMREVILNISQEIGLKPKVGLLRLEDVLDADECFITNATRGIQWVGAVDKKRFFKKKSERLINHLNQKIGLLS
jgi:branched-chain amino acid aminotransferase